jgi:hypothetical protein
MPDSRRRHCRCRRQEHLRQRGAEHGQWKQHGRQRGRRRGGCNRSHGRDCQGQCQHPGRHRRSVSLCRRCHSTCGRQCSCRSTRGAQSHDRETGRRGVGSRQSSTVAQGRCRVARGRSQLAPGRSRLARSHNRCPRARRRSPVAGGGGRAGAYMSHQVCRGVR